MSPSLSEKTEHSDQHTPATPATPVTPSEVTVGKIPKSRKQLEMEPFVPPSSVKKEVISDETDDDDIRVLETRPTTCDQQTKPHKLTPEEANGQTLTDGLAFYFVSLEIKVNQL